MIIVIADDFTGAAELAGIAMKYRLKTEVVTDPEINRDMDITIIDANTRSRSSTEAKITFDRILQQLNKYDYEFIYKKIDSVFRGHVYDEISVLLNTFQNKSVLLAPANPSRGRIISNGQYYIDGRLLEETYFSSDPEAPARQSDIVSLLGVKYKENINILKPGDKIPVSSGEIYVAEIERIKDVENLAKQWDKSIIPVGAADFFDAILSNRIAPMKEEWPDEIMDRNEKSLFICGSSLSRVVNLEEELFSFNPKVVEVSEDQICKVDHAGMIESIAKSVIDQYQITNNVILFVNASKTGDELPTRNIPGCLAAISALVLDKIEVSEIFIEGGTTSSEVVRKIGWNRFSPIHQLDSGVVRLQVSGKQNNYLIVKPGSYKWPDNLWNEKMMDQNHKH